MISTPEHTASYRHLFGPVPSRRLGRSLGIDLLPPKTCSFNCVYCQLGTTPHLVAERREWVPTAQVLAEIDRWAHSGAEADVATFAGSGEPTLHSGMGKVIDALHERTGLRTVVLTNGSLLYIQDVREQSAQADIVKVTLSAGDAETWNRLHRPESTLRYENFLEGLRLFAERYLGSLWLEVMLVEGLNDGEESVRAIADITRSLGAARVQLNTPVRPPAEHNAGRVSDDRLAVLANLFDPPAETLSATATPAVAKGQGRCPESIVLLDAIRRHPATADELARLFGCDADEVRSVLKPLLSTGRLEIRGTGPDACFIAMEHRSGNG